MLVKSGSILHENFWKVGSFSLKCLGACLLGLQKGKAAVCCALGNHRPAASQRT